MSEADLSALLEEAESIKAKASHQAAVKAPQSTHRYPGEVPQRLPSGPVKRTYFPSQEAGTKPLRLPKMGSSTDSAISSRSVSTPTHSTPASPPTSPTWSRGSPSSAVPRYAPSQNSSRALAAEASASASTRVFSARQVRSGLDSGKKLQEVLGGYVAPSASASRSSGPTDIDHLMEDLGLGDLNLTEEEAEAFLLDGVVPEGMELGGSRLRSSASKARDQGAARDVASQARILSQERRESAAMARRRQASVQLDQEEVPAGHSKEPSAPAPVVSDKTKALLDKVREKRASRLQSVGSVAGVADTGGNSAAEMLAALKAQGQKEDEEQAQSTSNQSEPINDVSQTATEPQSTDTITSLTSPGQDKAPEVAAAEAEPDAAVVAAADADDSAAEQQAGDVTTVITPDDDDDERDGKDASIVEPADAEADESTSTPLATVTGDPLATASYEQEDKEQHTPRPKSPVDSKAEPSTGVQDEEIDELLTRLHGSGHSEGVEDSAAEVSEKDLPAQADAPLTSSPPPAALEVQLPSTPPPSAVPETLSPASLSSAVGRGMSASASSGSAGSVGSSGTAPTKHQRAATTGTGRRSDHSSRRAIDIPRKMSDFNLSASAKESGEKGNHGNRPGQGSDRRPGSSASRSSSSARTASGNGMPLPIGASSPPDPSTGEPRSPRLKARLSSMRAFGSLGRKSRERDRDRERDREYPMSPPLPATANSSASTRAERSLSQILRDADAAMAEAGLDWDEGGEEGADGNDGGLSARMKQRQSIMPDDGLDLSEEWRKSREREGDAART